MAAAGSMAGNIISATAVVPWLTRPWLAPAKLQCCNLMASTVKDRSVLFQHFVALVEAACSAI